VRRKGDEGTLNRGRLSLLLASPASLAMADRFGFWWHRGRRGFSEE